MVGKSRIHGLWRTADPRLQQYSMAQPLTAYTVFSHYGHNCKNYTHSRTLLLNLGWKHPSESSLRKDGHTIPMVLSKISTLFQLLFQWKKQDVRLNDVLSLNRPILPQATNPNRRLKTFFLILSLTVTVQQMETLHFGSLHHYVCTQREIQWRAWIKVDSRNSSHAGCFHVSF